MKTKIFTSFTSAIIILLLINSCTKKKDDTPVTPKQVDYVCAGNGQNSYYPLAVNNEWTFPTISANGGGIYELVIHRNVIFNSISYFEIFNTQGYVDSYLRLDSTGDLRIYDSLHNQEFLLIPSNPTLNQTWNCEYSLSKKVISTNATVSTAACTYNGCLEIELFYSNGDPNTIYYYKKGFGLVRYSTQGLGGVTFDLMHLILN
jgi:hypothetical protein